MSRKTTIKTVFLLVLLFNSLAIFVAIALALLLGKPPSIYFQETSLICWVSWIQLLAIAYITHKTYKITQKIALGNFRQKQRFWRLISIGFLFLAVDEVLQIHERTDKLLHYILNLQETAVTDLLDDIIVACYVIVALIFLARNYPIIKQYKKSFVWFIIGFGLTFLMVVLDLLTNNHVILENFINDSERLKVISSWLKTVEDSAKIIAEGMFLVGFYHCWKIAQKFTRLKDRDRLVIKHWDCIK